jgi:hypothetical protein
MSRILFLRRTTPTRKGQSLRLLICEVSHDTRNFATDSAE